jgi:hypothetical protein
LKLLTHLVRLNNLTRLLRYTQSENDEQQKHAMTLDGPERPLNEFLF